MRELLGFGAAQALRKPLVFGAAQGLRSPDCCGAPRDAEPRTLGPRELHWAPSAGTGERGGRGFRLTVGTRGTVRKGMDTGSLTPREPGTNQAPLFW